MPDEYDVIWKDLNGFDQKILNEDYVYGSMKIWGDPNWKVTDVSDWDWVAAFCGMSV